jgi:hypothetical protein
MKCHIENENISFVSINNETKMWLRNSNKFISFNEFYECDLGSNIRFVFYIQEELQPILKKKQTFKKQDNQIPFNTNIDYPTYVLNKPENISLNIKDVPDDKLEIDPIATTLATIGIVYAYLNQIKQKKKQLENSKCCTDSKIELEKLNIKIDKLISDNESNKKTMYAEIYDHYKELKELKEDSTEIKSVVSKLIDRI